MHAIFRTIPILIFSVLFFVGCTAESRNARLKKKADKYFELGEYDKAKIEYLNLLRLDPQNAAAIQQLGIIWFDQGAPLRAVPFLLKSREFAPENLNARTRLAETFLALGEVAEARKEAFEILRREPANERSILVLADSTRGGEDAVSTKEQLKKVESSAPAAVHVATAVLAARNGEIAAAEKAVQRALELDPKSAIAHSARAKLLIANQELAEAGEEFRIAAELSPIRSTERLRYAEFKMQHGAVEEARTVLNEIAYKAPDFIPAWTFLARIALREKKYDEALTRLENVYGRDPMNYDALLLQAQARLGKGQTDKAVEGLKRLDEVFPKVPVTKLNLARAYLLSATPSQAVAALKEALEIDPNYKEASLLLAEINLRTGNPKPVVVAMKDLLAKTPNILPAQLLLAEAYRAMGNLSDSATVLRDQITVTPESSQAHFLLGLVLRQQQKPDEARKSFERAEDLAPDNNFLTLYQLTDLDIENKDYAAAHQRARQQIEKTPDSPGVHFVEGRIYAAQKDWALAESALLKAIELDVDFTSAYDLLVGIYMANEKLDEAVSQLEAFLERKPEDVRALLTSALIYERMKQYAKARDSYEKVVAATPGSAVAWNNLAWLYVEHLNDLDKAYEIASKARALRPDDGAIADTLGWTLYKRGDYQTALTLLQESAGKLPDQPEIQFHLGMAAYMMGLPDLARGAFRRAAESSSEFSGQEEARRRLAMLGETGDGSTELSATDLEKLLVDHRDDPVAQMRLGEAYEREGAFAKAAQAYEETLDLNPKLVAATKKLAELYAGPLQKANKAFEFAKRARELAPADPQVAGILGRIAYQKSDFDWAYSLLQESRRQLAENAEILHDFAWAAYSLGKVGEAQDAMHLVLNSSPDSLQGKDAESFLAMTALVQAPSDLEAAEPEIEKICVADPDYVPALMARARIRELRGDREAAVATYRMILVRFPDFAPAQKLLAALYLDDPAKSAKAYELVVKARKTLPDDPELAETLGRLSYQRKEFAYAGQLLEESARSKPLDAEGLYYLGMSRLQLNQNAEARGALEESLASGLGEPLAADAERVIAELRRK